MWIMLHDAFFSIVSKDCAPHQLMVRARRRRDIPKVFPNARVTESKASDYQFRAVVTREAITAAMAAEIERINYPNFKDVVRDQALHDAYLRVWTAMAQIQPGRPAPPAPKKK